MGQSRRAPSRSSKPDAEDEGGSPPTTGATAEGAKPPSIERVRELIVVARHDAALRATPEGSVAALGTVDVGDLADLLAAEGATMRPLFGPSEERLLALTASLAAEGVADVPDLTVYYKVDAPDERMDELAARLREHEAIETAYVKPPAEPAQWLNDMFPLPQAAPPATPDFTARQVYLDAAPAGIDARYAWTQPGGSGTGVRVIDVEGAWRFSHEDLGANQGGVIGGTQSTDIGWRNHGTAVVGEIGGDRNTIGITGICPDANTRAIAIFGGTGSAGAIRQAADALNPGDIILIELHRPGPRFNFASRADQRGYIAVEWWEDDFAAIRYATAKGVVVVEAGGNGAENLDDPLYSARPAGFPATWTNPFNRANRDSGAIVVGAGAPPPGTHGRNHGPDRSRLDFSNFGALVDVQGWGREVTTTGYGDLQGGTSEDLWYTDQFSGTSSSSPIVVGALGCVQGVLRARGRQPLTPAQARQLLRSTGSPQQDAPNRPASQRIGNRPNLRQAIDSLKSPVKEGKDALKEFKDNKNENKELKREKAEKNEFKELKREKAEKNELKEFKREKAEKNELKEVKREKLEIKEKEKDIRERLDVGLWPQDAGALAGDLEERVAALESAVLELAHFISPELRPDLSVGALRGEPDAGGADLAALSQRLAKEAADAKALKDDKDVEKLGEY